MKINLAKLSDLELLSLISGATAELSARAQKPVVERVEAPAREVVVVREPDSEQKDFVLMIKARMQRGQYIKAGERFDVAAITSKFPEWAKIQRMPTTAGANAWTRAAEFITSPRAKER